MILFPLLGGAALGALIDGVLALPLAGIEGVRHAYITWSMGTTMVGALLCGVGMEALSRLPFLAWSRKLLGDGAAFWPGVFIGLLPTIAYFVPGLYLPGKDHWLNLAIWIALVGVICLLAPMLQKAVRVTPKFARTTLAGGAAVWLVSLFWFGSASVDDRPPMEVTASAFSQQGAAQENAPDLVLISIDTLRSDLSLRGEFLLPHLLEHRVNGTWSSYGLSPANQTVPGHVALLTGYEHGQHGIARNVDMAQLEDFEYFANRLHNNGYQTAAVVSNAMMLGDYGWKRGYEFYDDSDAEPGAYFFFVRKVGRLGWPGVILGAGRSTTYLMRVLDVNASDIQPPAQSLYATGQAERLIELFADGERPYHLFVHYMDPHAPYLPPEETKGKFANDEDLPERFAKWSDDHRQLIGRIEEAFDEEPRDALAAAEYLRDLYDEEILFMDSQLRRLTAAIEATGRPTIMVVTSDHGEYFGEHRLMEHSKHIYEPVVRVPFACFGLNGAEVPARESTDPLDLIDVAPTFLAAAGLDIPDVFRGRNLLAAELPAIDHIARWSSMASIRRGPWKLIVNLVWNSEEGNEVVPIGVYNLESDPEESLPLILSDCPDSERMMRRMTALLGEAAVWREKYPEEDAPVAKKNLMEALGYLDQLQEDPANEKDKE